MLNNGVNRRVCPLPVWRRAYEKEGIDFVMDLMEEVHRGTVNSNVSAARTVEVQQMFA